MAHSRLLICLLITLTTPAFALWKGTAAVVVTELWTFPLGTWIENLIVRSNGMILATSIATPQVWEVDPHGETPAVIVATIPNHLALAGIAEVEPDVFYVAANNFSINGLSAQPNSSAVYQLDFSKCPPGGTVKPRLVARFAESGLLNGVTTFDHNRGILFVGDSALGHVWSLNVHTGEKAIIASNQLMTVVDSTKEPIGVNGLKFDNGWLYWSNTNQEIFARVSVSSNGFAKGPAQLLAKYAAPDDFIVLGPPEDPVAFVAGDDAFRVIDRSNVKIISTSPLLEGSTAVQRAPWIDSMKDFFVSTNGGTEQYLTDNLTNPGKIVRVSTK